MMQEALSTQATPRPNRLDVAAVRREFPALNQQVNGHPLIYLDSAATALKTRSVLAAVQNVYERDAGPVHRGVHATSARATKAYEAARAKVQRFIGASHVDEIIFTRGTTESINLVANTWGRKHIQAGDEILVSALEHHSNIVPWQMLCEEKGATLRVIPMADNGDLLLEQLPALLTERTKLLAVMHVSNALGTVLPVRKMLEQARARGITTLIDGAQAIAHLPVDVLELGCDFYAFSGHKIYGPGGIGVLYGRRELLAEMPPFQGGGNMITSVSFEKTTYAKAPAKFEAGTPNIEGAIGLGAALDFVQALGMDQIQQHDAELLAYARKRLNELGFVRLVGNPRQQVGAQSFWIEGVHPHDIGTIVDTFGVAIRVGHHCTQPVMTRLKLPATARVSFGIYNTTADVDAFTNALLKVKEMFL